MGDGGAVWSYIAASKAVVLLFLSRRRPFLNICKADDKNGGFFEIIFLSTTVVATMHFLNSSSYVEWG